MNSIDRSVTAGKSAEILERIKEVFARRGFQGASMQELAQAAQMSVGNFYRYFSSKDEIIKALVERDLQRIQQDFTAARESADKGAAFKALAGQRMRCTTPEEAALWSEIEAVAYRNPEIAALRDRMEDEVRANIVNAMLSMSETTKSVDLAELNTKADVVILLVKGLAKKRGLAAMQGMGDESEQLTDEVLKLIHCVMSPQVAADD